MSGYDEPTPRSWKPDVEPTPEQLASWLAICTHNERVALARALILMKEGVLDCVKNEHVNTIVALERVIMARQPVIQLPDGRQVLL